MHVFAAIDLILQRMLLVEMRLLEIFLETRAEVAADLALQVAGHPLTLELDHAELVAGMGRHGVLIQGADAADLLQ